MQQLHLPTTIVPTVEPTAVRWVTMPGTQPDAAPVLFIHGLGCSSSSSFADAAVRLGRPALLVDLIGHGLSDRPRAFGYTLLGQADALAAVIRSTGFRVDVVGHSLGGSIAIVLAERHPELVRRVVLVEPGIDPVTPTPGDLASCDEEAALAGGWLDVLAQETPERRAEMRLADPVAIIRSAIAIMDALGGTLHDRLLGLTVPILLLSGQRRYDSENDFAAAGITVARIANAAHFLMLDAPENFAAVVGRFLGDGLTPVNGASA